MLCGGEPLIVPHFFAIAETLGKAGIQLKIETNGQRFDARAAERLAQLPVRSIQISLDGATEDSVRAPAARRLTRQGARRLPRGERAGTAARSHFRPDPTQYPRSGSGHRAGPGARRVSIQHRETHAHRHRRALVGPIGADVGAVPRLSGRCSSAGPRGGNDDPMELCYSPFSVEEGLRRSLADPPATLLVLPNGWVKVAAAAAAHLRRFAARTASSRRWDAYRRAWRNAMIVGEVSQAIAAESRHPKANNWQSVLTNCSG